MHRNALECHCANSVQVPVTDPYNIYKEFNKNLILYGTYKLSRSTGLELTNPAGNANRKEFQGIACSNDKFF